MSEMENEGTETAALSRGIGFVSTLGGTHIIPRGSSFIKF